MTDVWNPDQYAKFADERARPFHDLLDLVEPAAFARAVDLGCGSGELTVLAAERLGVGEMVALDNSPAMLAKTDELARSGLAFGLADIGTWAEPEGFDLVIANASLQWVPGHFAVLGRWTESLRPGGQMAVQVPANADHPSHLCAVEIADTEPFRSLLPASAVTDPVAGNVLAPEEYASLLFELGYAAHHVRLQVYGPVLDSTAGIVEWVKGTTLTRFQRVLPADLYTEFLERYRRRLIEVLGDRSPYFYPFKRILMWGRLPG